MCMNISSDVFINMIWTLKSFLWVMINFSERLKPYKGNIIYIWLSLDKTTHGHVFISRKMCMDISSDVFINMIWT